MKVVFLDFDGVVSTDAQRLKAAKQRLAAHEHLCRPLVQRVNRIVDATGAHVVVSTNWRIEYSKDALEQILRNAGATFPLLSTTPTSRPPQAPSSSHITESYPTRGHEIEAWLEGCGEMVDAFVILDDLPRNEFDHFGRQHLITTDPTIGLTDVGVQRAIRMLMMEGRGFARQTSILVP